MRIPSARKEQCDTKLKPHCRGWRSRKESLTQSTNSTYGCGAASSIMCFHSAYFQLVRRSTDLRHGVSFHATCGDKSAVLPGFRSQAFDAPLGKRAVRMIEYSPEHFDALQTVAKCIGAHCNLGHRPFVDYYYASSDWCKLFMILADDGSAIATSASRRCLSNMTPRRSSLDSQQFPFSAFRAGDLLFLHWQDLLCRLVYGGSEERIRSSVDKLELFYWRAKL